MNKNILTVTQLNLSVKEILETSFFEICVEGELSNFSCPKSGHWYFSLKDESSQVRCAMFRHSNLKIKSKPKNGDLIQVKAKVSLYSDRGEFQLIVTKIDLAGEGLLRKKYEELLNKLTASGLFLPKWKQPLPKLPQRIGIITSPTGAAVRDIISVLQRRFPAIPITIYPTEVQGQRAASQIIMALQSAIAHSVCDVLIIARGGGSLEDLWPFNSEELALAVFNCKIPIVSGVGHEVDFTICDYVADQRAPTPSVAGELVSLDKGEILTYLANLDKKLNSYIVKEVSSYKQKLDLLRKRLRHPGALIKLQLEKLQTLTSTISVAIKNKLKLKRAEFSKTLARLNAVSPLATLDRGYSIVSKKTNGEIIASSASLEVGDKVKLRFSKGEAEGTIDNIIT